jgi:BirA family biotin operon repressor/biotin-[acetyl-CoA-carboxylase] ligase
MSVLLRPVLEPPDLYLCTVTCALALAAGCEAVGGVRPRLKWPNDLVIDDAKLAGILAESDPGAPGGAPGSVAVVVGMGCNLTWPGPGGAGGTSLSEHVAGPVGRDEVLEPTLDDLRRRLPALESHEGRQSIVDELRSMSATLGRLVRVTTEAGGDLVGVATGLTDAGHLVVRTEGGDVEVAAGDVTHLRNVVG